MRLQNYLPRLAKKHPKFRITPTKKYNKILRNLTKKAKNKRLDLGYAKSSVRCFLCGSRGVPLDFISKLSLVSKSIWDTTFREISWIRSERSDKPIKIVKEASSGLFYILGAFRDASVSKHKGQIQMTQKKRAWVDETINPLMMRVFGIKLLYAGKRGNFHIFQIGSKSLQTLLTLFRKKQGRFEDTSKLVKSAEIGLQRFYIGGFYDAEGDKSLKSNRVGIYQAWKTQNKCPPLEDIKNILKEKGIDSSIQKGMRKKNSYVYRLYVFKRPFENILKFFDFVPLFHPDSIKLKEHIATTRKAQAAFEPWIP